MRFRIEQRFAGAVDAVQDAFVTPAYLERLATLPKLGAPELLDQVVDGDTVHQWVRYRFTGDVNAAVRAVVDPARLTWVEESTIHRASHRTTWRIIPDNYAHMISASGTFTLVDVEDAATRRLTEGVVSVRVPLAGGRVERAIVSGLEEHAAAEEPVLDAWLRSAGGERPSPDRP